MLGARCASNGVAKEFMLKRQWFEQVDTVAPDLAAYTVRAESA